MCGVLVSCAARANFSASANDLLHGHDAHASVNSLGCQHFFHFGISPSKSKHLAELRGAIGVEITCRDKCNFTGLLRRVPGARRRMAGSGMFTTADYRKTNPPSPHSLARLAF